MGGCQLLLVIIWVVASTKSSLSCCVVDYDRMNCNIVGDMLVKVVTLLVICYESCNVVGESCNVVGESCNVVGDML